MLKDVTLTNLSEGQVEQKFQEVLGEAMNAWAEGRGGKCRITISIELKPHDSGAFVALAAKTKISLPDRATSSVLMLKDGRLKVETTSNDAREPGLFEHENVVPLTGGVSR